MLNFADKHPLLKEDSWIISLILSIIAVIVACMNIYLQLNLIH